MIVGNYCRRCGQRILPNEPYCKMCGSKTGYHVYGGNYVFEVPVHNIGFFDFDIDFSPYIESSRDDFKYEICSCGYLNHVDNEYCYMCGAKRSQSKLEKIFNRDSKPKFSIDNILCECGAVNSRENTFCEMCGKQLKEDYHYTDNYSNFNLEFEDSRFCFCGEENDKFSFFCKNCGFPLVNYGKTNDVYILCTCSTINEVTSDFCIECGSNLNRENSVILCVCGEKNPEGSKFCQSCDRPLNPQKTIKTRLICSCGEILDWNSDYCHNCGKNIKMTLRRKNSINSTVKSLKNMFR
ncbi:MAG: zinc ribbon domain-containing protein [Methanobrevibacter sp.]|nr:zinc ribbon domain-containing protein [Methanobrevibacter sp.]